MDILLSTEARMNELPLDLVEYILDLIGTLSVVEWPPHAPPCNCYGRQIVHA